MKRILLPLLTALWLPALACAAQDITVLTPFDNAIVRLERTFVMTRVPIDYRPLIRRGEETLTPFQVGEEDETELLHVRLALEEGDNHLTWTDPESGELLAERHIFHVPPNTVRKVVAKGGEPFFLHVAKNEEICHECHDLPGPEATARDIDASEAENCTVCHPKNGGEEALHPPAIEFACFKCHQADYKPNRFRVDISEGALCDRCHTGFLTKILGGSKYVHGPVAMAACLICHEPHGKGKAGLHRLPEPELCAQCHPETVERKTSTGPHADLDCTECHRPHAASTSFLTLEKGNALCLGCHDDPTLEMQGHPLPGHPVAGPLDPSYPGAPFWCISCHTLFRGVDVSQMNIQEDEEAQVKFCNRCH